jgi:O-antigen/teichoic acid export membrane protein
MSEAGKSGRVFRGGLWTVGMRWTDRLIGFISTLILARLLAPSDFGVIAMATIVIGLIEVLLDLGVNITLIQNADAQREDYDTAWTVRFVQSALVAALVFACAPLAADYFRDERVIDVLRVLAIAIIIAGCENIGVISFQKSLDFSKDYQFTIAKRLFGFVVTIAAAATLHNYWALVIGTLSGRCFGVAYSYGVHPYRPRFCLAKFREIWGFSQWILIRGIVGYVDAQMDKFVVARRGDSDVVGVYALAAQIATMPTTELLAPLSRVLFPAFVQNLHNPERLKRDYLLALGVQALIGIPASIGLALVAEEAVIVLLGAKWLLAIPLVQWLALAAGCHAVGYSGAYVLIAKGRFRTLATVSWVFLIAFAVFALLIFPDAGAEGIARLRLFLAIPGLLIFNWFVLREIEGLAALELLGAIVRPVLACTAMALAVAAIDGLVTLAPTAALLLKIGAGALVYVAVLLGAWFAAGRADGAEAYLLRKFGLAGR